MALAAHWGFGGAGGGELTDHADSLRDGDLYVFLSLSHDALPSRQTGPTPDRKQEAGTELVKQLLIP